MLIGIDASRANRPVKTGVEWYSYHLIEQLKKIDLQNEYHLYTQKKLQGSLADCPNNFQEKVLRWLPIRLWTLIRLSYEMKYGKQKPDVLFVPAHTIPLVCPAKTVVTVHDIGFDRYPQYYHWADKLYHRWTMKFIARHARAIITVSEFSKKEIMDVYHIPAEKIFVTPIGFDSQTYYSLPLSVEEKKNLVKEKFGLDKPFFLYVGRLEKKKNIDNLIESFLLYKQRHGDDLRQLVLVGTRGLTFGEIEAQLELHNKLTDIVFLDYVKDSKDVNLLYNTADLFIFPSRYEGFGIPVLEAMNAGCAVICSNSASLPEVAGQAAIKFNPENIEAMVKAMETVVDNPEIKQALIEAGKQQAQNFSWNECAQKTLEIFGKL